MIGLIYARLVFALIIISFPTAANAGVFSFISDIISGRASAATTETVQVNSQNVAIFQATRTPNSNQGRGGGDITIIGGTALMPESGPVGTMADVSDGVSNETISTYVVRPGDNLNIIAKMFGVSVNTIIWANDIKGSIIRDGQTLVILPISGVEHTVVKGDTIGNIAKKYKADSEEISIYNDIPLTQTLVLGSVIIIPDGEIASPPSVSVSVGANTLRGASNLNFDGYYIRPIAGGVKTQGLHGYNGVDLATYQGAPIYAAAGGTVIVAATGGWNGGYGNYIVIAHPNGTQTLYGHALKVSVSVGEQVIQGQIIGLVGTTGKSTGPHVHFEVRGAKNPFGP